MNDHELGHALHALEHLTTFGDHPPASLVAWGKAAGVPFEKFPNMAYELLSPWKTWQEAEGGDPTMLYTKAKAIGWLDPSRGAAQSIWTKGRMATVEDAIIKKFNGNPAGLKLFEATDEFPLSVEGTIIEEGDVIVPMYENGILKSVQLLETGLELPGVDYGEAYFSLEGTPDTIYICSAIYIGWAISNSTQSTVVVGDVGNLAVAFRRKFPQAALVTVSQEERGSEYDLLLRRVASTVGAYHVTLDASISWPPKYSIDVGVMNDLLKSAEPPTLRFKSEAVTEVGNFVPMRWRVKGVLPAQGLGALYGPSMSGKSFLAIDLACAIAGGEGDWFGLRVAQAPVTYICLEGSAGIRKRFDARSSYNNKSLPTGLRIITESVDLIQEEDVSELATSINSSGGSQGVIIIDTLSQAAPVADENGPVGAGGIISSLQTLQKMTDCLVLVIHHAGKDESKGMRGSTKIFAAMDAVLAVSKLDKGRQWLVEKSKDDTPIAPRPFRLEIILMDTDEDGEEITSCAVAPGVAGGANLRGTLPPLLRANQAIASEVISSALRSSQLIGEAGDSLGKPCLRYDEAVDLVADQMETEPKRKKSRAVSAICGLVEKSILTVGSGLVWEC